MIRAVIDYIEMLIDLVRPKNLVYIAIDGVAPMAKIKHQRTRRFKSAKDFEIKSNIAKKFNKEYPRPWNNSAITPGTVFMKKLTKSILYHLQGKPKGATPVEYIFSSPNTPSEGEHKILQHIKKYPNGTKMIYGLDADLIYLGLASQLDNIKLLRETSEFQRGVTEGFSVLNIDQLKECIVEEIEKEVEVNRFIQDYIFMGFFLGNDFVPAIPSINFKHTKETLNGHTILMKTYSELFEGDYLITDKLTMNMKFLMRLLSRLVAHEEPYFREAAKQRMFNKPCESQDPFEVEIYRLENIMFKITDPIELGKEDVALEVSKKRYYEYYEMKPDQAIEKYFEGMQWTLQYYFKKCPDWLWFYPFEAAPFISDIYDYLQSHVVPKAQFIDGYKSIHPLQQLLMVLPTQSKYLLPKSYQEVMTQELKTYYPVKYELDFVMKNRYWQGVPKVPMINPWEVIKVTDKIPISPEEELRNRFQLEFKIMI
jgi:5'-3' exonuclease